MMDMNKNKLKLWYDKPAAEWVEALPLGNGRLGAMIYGDPFQETIQINEETIWSDGDNNTPNPRAKELVKGIRECILEGRLEQADLLAKEAYTGNVQGSYQTLGNILLNFGYGEGSKLVHSYRRELDIETALSRVRYTIGGINYRLESLISAVDSVFAMSMKASDGLSIQLEASLTRPHTCSISEGELPLSIIMKGYCGDEASIQYCAMLKIVPRFAGWGKQGHATCRDGKIVIENATDLLFYFTAATDYNTENAEKMCSERLQMAEHKGFEIIKRDHIEDYQRLFNRMKLSLGEDKLYDYIPTNERIMRMGDGGEDHALVALYYQYARYLLISSSRTDSELPANLQGIWNHHMSAPWGSRYTININTQMNYWVAEQCNLSECHEPLFRLIERLKVKGRIMARDMYGCSGFMAHHNTNIWGDASPQDCWPSATYWPMGAAWLCLHLWDRYEYTLDQAFLERAYPTLKEACEFFTEFLVKDKEGRMVTCPSLSPENVYRTAGGSTSSICAGPTMDSGILRRLFGAVIEAAGILGLDENFADKLIELRNWLPELKISRNGTIMEWPEDYEEVEIGHRHISQLFALHPSGEITVDGTPELATAAKKTLERRLSNGGGHTGWSCAWIINMWARLWEGDKAYQYVHTILAKSTYPNLFDAHPPFQIDGNFGAAAGVTEMLLQSNAGVVHLLPALPQQWPEGFIKGVCARGHYEVDLEWSDGQLLKAVISSNAVSTRNIVKVKCKNMEQYWVKYDDKPVPYSTLENGVISFDAENGRKYIIEKR